MKAVLIGALAATAFAETAIISYPGKYIVGTKSVATDCCYPDSNGVTVTQATDGKVTASWVFDSTCAGTNGATYKGATVSGVATAPTTGTGAVSWSQTVAGVANKAIKLETPANANSDFNLDISDLLAGCTTTLKKVPASTATIDYPGVYTVNKKLGATCCYPTGDIIVRNSGSNVNVDFTFDTCATAAVSAFSDKEISGAAAADSATKDVTVTDSTFTPGKTWTFDVTPVVDATYLLQLTSVAADCAATLTKKDLPSLTYNKVFEVEKESTATGCCYPAGEITATQDSTTKKVTLGWTFESDCTDAIKGTKITAVGDVDSVTGNVVATDSANSNTYTLIAPQTTTGAWNLDLSDISTGCAALLDTKSGYVLGLGSLVAVSLSYIMF